MAIVTFTCLYAIYDSLCSTLKRNLGDGRSSRLDVDGNQSKFHSVVDATVTSILLFSIIVSLDSHCHIAFKNIVILNVFLRNPDFLGIDRINHRISCENISILTETDLSGGRESNLNIRMHYSFTRQYVYLGSSRWNRLNIIYIPVSPVFASPL